MPISRLCFLLALLAGVSWMKAGAQQAVRGRIMDRNGIVFAESPEPGGRHYPLKNVAPHIIGYTGTSSPVHGVELKGKTGIEESFNDRLNGGEEVRLTLDATVQRMVERTLADHCSAGCAVIIDVNNGELLAMASNPGYDLNDFVPRVDEDRYEALLKNKHEPLVSRTIERGYNSGSTFKLVTALAGLKSGAIDAGTVFEGVPSMEIAGETYRNWHQQNEGRIGFLTAMKRSCNTWFFQAGIKMGGAPIMDMSYQLGFGQKTGLPLNGEVRRFLTNDAFYMQRGASTMQPFTIAPLSIGQIGTVTPVQVVVATAALANQGKVLVPRLIKDDEPTQYVTDLIARGLKPAHLDLVLQGMVDTVNDNDGTGHAAQVSGLSVAGKTGTMTANNDDTWAKTKLIGWFVAFAPIEYPKYAIAVVYEGVPGEKVSGGSKAAPVVKDVFGQMKKLGFFNERAVRVPMTRLEIAKANDFLPEQVRRAVPVRR
jgi:penicillin-binding protein 2